MAVHQSFNSDSSGDIIISPLTNSSILKSQLQDNAGNGITSTNINSKQRLDVTSASEAVDGATVPFQTQMVGGTDGTNIQSISVDTTGRPNVNIIKTVITPSSPTAFTVGVASASALASNANRKGLILTNTSIGKISFGLGVAAVLNSGITLYPGGVWVMDEFNLITTAINAISSVASSNLGIQEFT